MKPFLALLFLVPALAVGLSACDSHSFEETKHLHEGHGGGHAHGEAHGEEPHAAEEAGAGGAGHSHAGKGAREGAHGHGARHGEEASHAGEGAGSAEEAGKRPRVVPQ